MIRGTGIEFIALQDMRGFDEEDVRRQIWTPDELDFCKTKRLSKHRLAARYAAKKAILSAMGIQEAEDAVEVPLTDIEIRQSLSGAPYPVLRGTAAARAGHLYIARWHLSLTHTERYAAAFALAEGEDGEGVQKSGNEGG